jgi:hypothetical protein
MIAPNQAMQKSSQPFKWRSGSFTAREWLAFRQRA